MENFYNWMSKPVPFSEVEIWFSVHNMIPERIELFGVVFTSLAYSIIDTYFGEDNYETKVVMSESDKKNHFDWCWDKLIKDFENENILIDSDGEHKEYLWNFFLDSFYTQPQVNIREAIPEFIEELFNLEKPFAKSDLDILTELYKTLQNKVIHVD
jgi:hypothetical protein